MVMNRNGSRASPTRPGRNHRRNSGQGRHTQFRGDEHYADRERSDGADLKKCREVVPRGQHHSHTGKAAAMKP